MTQHEGHGPTASAATDRPVRYVVAATEDGLHEVSLLRPLNVLLRERRLIMIVVGIFGAIALLLTILGGAPYLATTTFVPNAPATGGSRIASLAEQLGLNIGVAPSSGLSVGFYASLVESRELLEEVALSHYAFPIEPGGTDSLAGTVLDIYGIQRPTEEQRVQAAVAAVRSSISVSQNTDAQMVVVRVLSRWPEFSEQVAQRVVDLVTEFNLRKRQSRAQAERAFVEARLREVEAALQVAEREVRRFLEENRRYQESPRLTFEKARLERAVDVQQQLYATLVQAYEQARIEEVRDTPVITVIDSPQGSAQTESKFVRNIVLGLFVGFILATLIAFLREYLRAQRGSHPEAYAEFHALKREAVSELARVPNAVVKRVIPRRPEATEVRERAEVDQ